MKFTLNYKISIYFQTLLIFDFEKGEAKKSSYSPSQRTRDMKKIILIISFICSAIFSSMAQEKEMYTLTVNISGLKSSKGTLIVGLYNQKDTFLKKQFQSKFINITHKQAVVIFREIPKGTYAVSFIHDENDNKKMDTNLFGIPKEDYGCSNNAKGFIGPPTYDDAKFVLRENKMIKISL